MIYFQGQSDQLFDKYYRPYPVISSTRGIDHAPSELIEAYHEKSYDKVISLYETLGLKNAEIQMVYANSLLLSEEPDKAKPIFQELTRNANKALSQYAEWYLALTLLKAGENKAAKIQLVKLIDGHMIHQPEAKELLNELKN